MSWVLQRIVTRDTGLTPGQLRGMVQRGKIRRGEHYAVIDRKTVYNIEALGIKLVTEKYGKAYAMALAGHADERMWRHYIEGHEAPKPVRVSFR